MPQERISKNIKLAMDGQVLGLNGENNSLSVSNLSSKMSNDSDEGKLFVGALGATTEERMKAYFSSYGEVTDCTVKCDPNNGKSRGFGFVTFKDPACAQKALNEGPHIIDGKKVDAKKASPVGKQRSAKTKKIFVGGLKPDAPEEIVRNYFSQYGTVVDVDLVTEKDSVKRRGFCFVEFDNEDVVDLVMQKQYHDLAQGIKVEVKPALTKEQQAAKKAQELSGGGGYSRGRGMAGGMGGYGYAPAAPGPYPSAYQSMYQYQTDPSAFAVSYPGGYGTTQPAYGATPAAAYPEYPTQQTYRGYQGVGGRGGYGVPERFHPYSR